jgi:hypothetical protein
MKEHFSYDSPRIFLTASALWRVRCGNRSLWRQVEGACPAWHLGSGECAARHADHRSFWMNRFKIRKV